MEPAERFHDTGGGTEELLDIRRSSDQAIQRISARIFEHQRLATSVVGKIQGPGRPCRVQFIPQRIDMVHPLNAGGGWMIRSRGHQENGQWIPFEPTPQNDKLPVFSDLLEGIAGQVHLESALDSIYHGIWRCLARGAVRLMRIFP